MNDLKTISISEWSQLSPRQIKNQYGSIKLEPEDFDIINKLEHQRKINIKNYSRGISLESYSYIGIVKLSNFQIVIKPKIGNLKLAKMLSFAYKMDNINLLENNSKIDIQTGAISDIIALLFIKESEEIIVKGLAKKYRERKEKLSSCRGKIMFNKLARKSSPDLTLPCNYQELTVDIAENKLILFVLKELNGWVTSSFLNRRINLLIDKLSSRVTYETLTNLLLEKVKQENNRLTKHYNTLIELAELILSNADFNLTAGKTKYFSFLIDMNLLFEKFLYQYFNVYSDSKINIKYQESLRNNYVSSRGDKYKMIPDYKFFKDSRLIAIADAKYKNYDVKNINSAGLYQLTSYRVANYQGINKIYLFYPALQREIEKKFILQNNIYDKKIKIIVIGIPLNIILDGLDSNNLDIQFSILFT